MVCPGCQHHFCWLCLEPFIISEKHPTFDNCLINDKKVTAYYSHFELLLLIIMFIFIFIVLIKDTKMSQLASSQSAVGKLKFFHCKFENGYKDCSYLSNVIQENGFVINDGINHVNTVLQQEIYNLKYLAWSFVFELFLKSEDHQEWNTLKQKLETSTIKFLKLLKTIIFYGNGQYTDSNICDLTSLNNQSSKIVSEMTQKQYLLEGNLTYSLNYNQSTKWCCVNCEYNQNSNDNVCSTTECNTCRDHAIQDCMVSTCKKPTWTCGKCSFEQSIKQSICNMCFHEM